MSPDLSQSIAQKGSSSLEENTVEEALQDLRSDLWRQGYNPDSQFKEYLNWFVFSVVINAGEPELFCKGQVKDLDYGQPMLHTP